MGYLPVGVAGALLQLSSLKRLDVEVALLSGRDHGGQGPPDHPGQDLPGFEGPPAWPPHLPHAQPEAGSDLKGPPAMDDGPDSSDSDDEDDDDEPPGMLTEGEDTEEEEEEADGGDDGRLAASLAPLWAGLEHLSLRSVKADDSVLAGGRREGVHAWWCAVQWNPLVPVCAPALPPPLQQTPSAGARMHTG